MLKERFFVAFLLLAVWNLLLALSAACLCAYVAPAAAGSGIPEVKAYLNGIDSDSILAPSTLFVKVIDDSIKQSKQIKAYLKVFFFNLDCWIDMWSFVGVGVGERRSDGAHRSMYSLVFGSGRV